MDGARPDTNFPAFAWDLLFSFDISSPSLTKIGCPLKVLKCLNQFIHNFPSLIHGEFTVIMGPFWQTFMSSLGVYTRSSIEGTKDPYKEKYDSDGPEMGLHSFSIQMFEFLLTIVSHSKFAKVITSHVKELFYYTIAFLQMTEQHVHTWPVNANEFVPNEDVLTYSCSVSGVLILEEVITSCSKERTDAIVEADERRFSESWQQKAAGWWRLESVNAEVFAADTQNLRIDLQKYWSLLSPLIFSDHPKRRGNEDPAAPYNMARNGLDMNFQFGRFNSPLLEAVKNLWVMNVVPSNAPNHLPAIFDRGSVGVYKIDFGATMKKFVGREMMT